jgi:aminopeptidase-like protein
MNMTEVRNSLGSVGSEMHSLIREMYPICRSITGNGVRATLDLVKQHIPLQIHEVPSGTPVFDWTVPREWNIIDAYIANKQGERVIDFQKSNLHVLNYSIPFSGKVSLEELKKHLYSLPDHPDWIPYRTSYYNENWGFCVTHNQLLALKDEEYEVCIMSSLEPGSLTYGEYVIPGQTDDEVLISCHVCHPSLANDNLSGIALGTFLAKLLSGQRPYYTYRFLFIPGTIGSITWLALNEYRAYNIKHGLVLTCVGDPGNPTYKKTRRGEAEIDRAAIHILKHSGKDHTVLDYYPYGYDERQYNSPGFNLPIGVFMRSQHGTFPQYHTSADNLDLVRPQYLADSLSHILSIFNILQNNRTYLNLNPKCEPQLGKRGIYKAIAGQQDTTFDQMAMFWVLSYSDGEHSLLDIAERANMSFEQVKKAADLLETHELLRALRETERV